MQELENGSTIGFSIAEVALSLSLVVSSQSFRSQSAEPDSIQPLSVLCITGGPAISKISRLLLVSAGNRWHFESVREKRAGQAEVRRTKVVVALTCGGQ